MNSKSIGLYLDSGDDSGRIEVYEPDMDDDINLVLYDPRGKELGTVWMSKESARSVAMMLIVAAEYRV